MSNTNPFLNQADIPQSAYYDHQGHYMQQRPMQQPQQQSYASPAHAPPLMQQKGFHPPHPVLPLYHGQPMQQQDWCIPPPLTPQVQVPLQYATAPSHPLPQYAGPTFGDSSSPFQASGSNPKKGVDEQPMLDEDGKPMDPRQVALAWYGSPFAHSADWAPTSEDFYLTALPQRAIMMRIKMRFARTAGDIFNPPAPSFAREPSRRFHYAPFNSVIVIPQESKELADGFKSFYPGRILVDHDVSTADWGRFLEDITVAGRLTGGQAIVSQVAPLTMHLGASGYFITKAIERGMKRKKEPVINEAVETWQQNFFIRRGLDVYLRHGNERTSARAPGEDVPRAMSATTIQPPRLEPMTYDSDSSGSSSSNSSHKHKRHRKHDKQKKDKKDKTKKDEKHKKDKDRKDKDRKWFLVIDSLVV